MATFTATVTSGDVAATLTNYPAYIDLSEMPASFWSTVVNGGGDIRVYSDAGLTTEMAREVVSCDTSDDTGELHTLVASLTTSTVLYITVDGTSSEPAVGATYGRNAVWADYSAVWHLNQSSGSAIDSTGNTNNGTFEGTLPNKVAGLVGDAQDFNGSSDQINVPDDASFSIAAGDFNVQYLFKTSASSTQYQFHYAEGDASSDKGLILYTPSGGEFRVLLRDGSSQSLATSSGTFNDGNWHYGVGNRNGTRTGIYVDGTDVGSVTSSLDVGGSFDLHLGSGDGEDYYDGLLQEVRIINNDYRAATWITTEYNNQSDVAGFWTIAEAAGGATFIAKTTIL